MGGLAAFRRLLDLEGEGLSRESAVKVIEEDLASAEQDRPEPLGNDREGEGNLVAILERVIEDQRQQIDFLQRQVETLTPLALAPPRRGVFRVFRRNKREDQ